MQIELSEETRRYCRALVQSGRCRSTSEAVQTAVLVIPRPKDQGQYSCREDAGLAELNLLREDAETPQTVAQISDYTAKIITEFLNSNRSAGLEELLLDGLRTLESLDCEIDAPAEVRFGIAVGIAQSQAGHVFPFDPERIRERARQIIQRTKQV